eukprot:gb/GECG01014127.1/.p1 GENE.gb/GECG01014127.1/~~gb/GECG01014127.1/.p1  ORF type:complete len:426 (+),score=53.32 gb/GECG01014127.1/:1-1278(+)
MSHDAATMPYAHRLDGLNAPSVWHEFNPLAQQYAAVNLGQGAPNWQAPRFLKEALKRATDEDFNQYARASGHMPLVEELAKHYTNVIGRTIDPSTEITTTIGASEALYAAVHAYINTGDEVVTLEPAFDLYTAQVKMAGGIMRYVPLRLTDGKDGQQRRWYLDMEELEAAITPNTKMFILNTPHNPTGKTFDAAELEEMAKVFEKHPQVLAVSDEVYEHMTYDGKKHVQLASVRDMWKRTLTVSSAGKTFSVTGWKIGWVVGPSHLVKGIMLANTWIHFAAATPLQQGLAYAFQESMNAYEGSPNYFDFLRSEYLRKREKLATALRDAGLEPILPEGGFFIMADTSSVEIPRAYLEASTESCPKMQRDWAFCRWMTIEKGICAIPPSAFYQEEDKHLAANLARFAFCKTDEALDEAAKILKKLRQ